MSVAQSYNRLKATLTAATSMVFTLLTGEQPNTPVAVTAGTTGILDARLQVDANPGGAPNVRDIVKTTIQPVLSATGALTLTITCTPVSGDGSTKTPSVFSFVHPDSIDVFQTAAGDGRS